MGSFRRAKAQQAVLKLGLYGPTGAGKTFTSLLLAEGLAKHQGKRIAYVDTERGTDFYAKDIPARQMHPAAFDFDALYTRSITDILNAVRSLDSKEYAVAIIDSITHVWEAARLAYGGKETTGGGIPLHAWAKIKKPYKELMNLIMSSSLHVIICGRQGNEYDEHPETGELRRIGVKMRAEVETPYEPHILVRLENRNNTISAIVEKDRTGVLTGKIIQWPNFDNMINPILPYLDGQQAVIPDEESVSRHDAECLAEEDTKRTNESKSLLDRYKARLSLAENNGDLTKISRELTSSAKKQFLANDLTVLRNAFLETEKRLGKHLGIGGH